MVELTGDFSLALPVMLAVAIASSVSRVATYGTIYTEKLLRRGTDIDRATPLGGFRDLNVADAMHPFRSPLPVAPEPRRSAPGLPAEPATIPQFEDVQALFANESLAQALRQLLLYGRDGLPVMSTDGQQLVGWLTNQNVLEYLGRQIDTAQAETLQAELVADGAAQTNTGPVPGEPRTMLRGYKVAEITLPNDSSFVGQTLQDITWPEGAIPVSVLRDGRLRSPNASLGLNRGDQVNLLVALPADPKGQSSSSPDETVAPRMNPPGDHASPTTYPAPSTEV